MLKKRELELDRVQWPRFKDSFLIQVENHVLIILVYFIKEKIRCFPTFSSICFDPIKNDLKILKIGRPMFIN